MSLKHGTECSTCPSLYVHPYLKKQTNKTNFYFPLNYLYYFSQHLKNPRLTHRFKIKQTKPRNIYCKKTGRPKIAKEIKIKGHLELSVHS